MKKLYLKTWYVKKTCFDGKYQNEKGELINDAIISSCEFAGETEKAVKLAHYDADNGRIDFVYLPKSALLVCEENAVDEYERLDRKDNAPQALASVQAWLKRQITPSWEQLVALKRNHTI